ncbi:MAG: phosphotransferase [Deltaproteobacteria bacterium]|nr:phosphotransferase [Deltaproteobacteria bacterium]
MPSSEVLNAFGLSLPGVEVVPLAGGLIHQTFLARDRSRDLAVLQRMHPIFGPEVMHDIEAVTSHLEALGLPTTRVITTRWGGLHFTDGDAKTWRALTCVAGVTFERVESPSLAAEAGSLVSRFHRALGTMEYEFRHVRSGVHDTAAFLNRLEQALHATDIPGREHLARLAEAILDEARRLPALGTLPRRVTHGDLKISNVRFTATTPTRAHALLDLDTLGRLPLSYELGDAFRSWCNPLGEDVEATRFDEDIFAAAVNGYAREAKDGWLAAEEVESLVPGLLTICVELAARFCLDAFEDRYFGWDPQRFPSRREHNRVRAAGQLCLAREVLAVRGKAEEVVRKELRCLASSSGTS